MTERRRRWGFIAGIYLLCVVAGFLINVFALHRSGWEALASAAIISPGPALATLTADSWKRRE